MNAIKGILFLAVLSVTTLSHSDSFDFKKDVLNDIRKTKELIKNLEDSDQSIHRVITRQEALAYLNDRLKLQDDYLQKLELAEQSCLSRLTTSLGNISKRQWLIGAGLTTAVGIAAYITYKYMNREEERPKQKKRQ